MPSTRKTTLTEQLQQAIDASGKTRYRISKDTGISQSVLSLFCNGQRGLSLAAVDVLVSYLDLELTPRKPRERKVD